jgi:hypothetical protein
MSEMHRCQKQLPTLIFLGEIRNSSSMLAVVRGRCTVDLRASPCKKLQLLASLNSTRQRSTVLISSKSKVACLNLVPTSKDHRRGNLTLLLACPSQVYTC